MATFHVHVNRYYELDVIAGSEDEATDRALLAVTTGDDHGVDFTLDACEVDGVHEL